MLVWLTHYLEHYYGGFRVFEYLTFRTILGTLTALLISLLVGPVMIRRLTYYQVGQSIRDDGPKTHFSKAGTPTMGGALILVAVTVSILLWGDLSNRYVWTVILVTLGFGCIGWVDDYRKLIRKNSKGLPARWKYLWQSVIGLGAACFLYYTASSPAETQLVVPFLKHAMIHLGACYILLAYFVIVGTSNAVNLTDGLDGLATLPIVMVAAGLGVFAYLSGNVDFANI